MNTISIRRLGILFLLIIFVAVPMTTVAGNNGGEKVRVYVEFAVGHKGAVRSALARAGAQVHYEFDELNSFVVSLPEAALKGIEHNPNVVSVEEDALRYLAGAATRATAAIQSEGDPYEEEQMPYGVDMVQAPDVWGLKIKGKKKNINGAGRTVCIIDTGYYAAHEDLPDEDSSQIIGGTSQVDENFAEDGYGHGSHVAGTIAGIKDNGIGVVGVAPGVNLYIVKIFDNDGEWVSIAHSSDLVDAAYTCAENGANVISMSLSGTQATGKEEKAFAKLYERGILSVAAASNDGIEEYHYPASYPSVVSVAAIDKYYKVADFSQFNDAVELAAPGVGVLSTIPYISTDELVVGDDTYVGHGVEYSAEGTASGALVDGGLCATTGDWTDMVVLCQRGDITFYDKVMNVQNSGGVAAVIYNNVDEELWATLGDGTSDIPAIGLNQEDGLSLVALIEDEEPDYLVGDVTHLLEYPASGYEAWNGTSMATPHVSAVAALIWSANTEWSNVAIREAMTATAMDLGDEGYDVHYGYGLVQALGALEFLQ